MSVNTTPPNPTLEATRRPAAPFVAGRQFGRARGARPSRSAGVVGGVLLRFHDP